MKQLCLTCCEASDVAPMPLRLIGTLMASSFSQGEASELIHLLCPGCNCEACCCLECIAIAEAKSKLAGPPCPKLAKQGIRRPR